MSKPISRSPARAVRTRDGATARLVRVSCDGCGRACHLGGRSHPEVTTRRTGVADVRHCTRGCFDAARAAGRVS